MKKLILLSALLISTNVFATSSADTAEAVTEAISLFEKSQDEQTIADFKGIKASPNSHGVSVTIYLNNGPKLKYGCHRHSANEPFECHSN